MSKKEHFGIAFLKENNAWERFVKNTIADNDRMYATEISIIAEIVKAAPQDDYLLIGGYFEWNQTLEGMEYWSELDFEYGELLDELNKK